MNKTILDLLKTQTELKNRLVPKNIQAILDLKRKLQPLKALQHAAIQQSPIGN